MAYENLIVIDRGPVRTVHVNRPDKLNALNKKTLLELERALGEIENNQDVRVAVLTGAGDKSFIAGADIDEMAEMSPKEAREFSAVGHRVLDKVADLRAPVIAAVNGFALGGGLEVALACDFIYAADTAVMGLVETNLGLIPGFGGIGRLARRVGKAMAAEMIFAAKKVKADEALRIGLANKVVAAADLSAEVGKIADIIAEKGPYAVGLSKRLLKEGENADLRLANAFEQHAFGLVFSTVDHVEGIKSFQDKRKATFRGA
jgi:enoyl-CoA hydratase